MKLFDSISLAALSVSAKKSKVFLNVLGIVIGLSSVIIIMSIGKGGEVAVLNQLDRFGINAVSVKPSSGKGGIITSEDADYLKNKLTGAECIIPVYTNFTTIQKDSIERETMLWGVGQGFEKLFPTKIISGRLFTEGDIFNAENVAIIDEGLAKRFFGSVQAENKKIIMNINSNSVEFTVKGVFEATSKTFDDAFGDSMPTFVYIPHTTAMSLYGAKTLDYISVKAKDTQELEQMGVKAVRLLERKKDEKGAYYADNFSNQKDRLADILNIFTIVVSAAASISLIVGGIGVMNLMLMSVSERTTEIGVMKAIGASNSDVMTQFMIEAVFITLCGGIIGVTLGVCLGYLLAHYTGLPFIIESNFIIIALVFSVAIGLIFGVYPAKKAAKLNPIEALRRE